MKSRRDVIVTSSDGRLVGMFKHQDGEHKKQIPKNRELVVIKIGYSLSSEELSPKELVRYAKRPKTRDLDSL